MLPWAAFKSKALQQLRSTLAGGVMIWRTSLAKDLQETAPSLATSCEYLLLEYVSGLLGWVLFFVCPG